MGGSTVFSIMGEYSISMAVWGNGVWRYELTGW